MKRILIVKMWALGDLLIATPMIAALRAKYPGIHISWIVDSTPAELLRGHPGIDDLIVLDSGTWRRKLRRGALPAWLYQTIQLRREMARHDFDAVINCHPEKWWTAALCAASIRVGLYPNGRLPPLHRLYTTAIPRPQKPQIHETAHYLLATRALGCPDADLRLTIGETPDEDAFLRDFERAQEMTAETPLVVLAPFTTSETKTWEPDRYAEVASRLSEQYPEARVAITLGPKDGEAAHRIAALAVEKGGTRPIVAEGTSLRQYVALLRRACVVISGDSSPVHIAAALGTPYVTLFGSTDPAKLAPLRGAGRILVHPPPCAPCFSSHCTNPVFRECLKRITVEEVLAAAALYLPTQTERIRPVAASSP